MVQYRGYAQQTKKINALQIPDQSAKIISQGAKILESMRVVQQTDLENANAWLAARKDADRQEARNLEQNFKLSQDNYSLINKHEQNNFRVEANNAKVKGEQEVAMWKLAADLSSKAAVFVQEREKKWREEEISAGAQFEALHGYDVKEQMGAKIGKNEGDLSSQAGLTSAAYAESVGKGLNVTQPIRERSNKWFQQGRQGERAIALARNWTVGSSELMKTDLVIHTTDNVTGERISIPANQIEGAQQTSDALNQMIAPYLRNGGVDLTRVSAENKQALKLIGNSITTQINSVYKLESEAANKMGLLNKLDGAYDNPSARSLYEAYSAHSVAYGDPKKAFDTVYGGLMTAKNEDGTLRFTRSEIESWASQTSMPDQPGVSVFDRFSQNFTDGFRDRQVESYKSQTNVDNARTGQLTRQLDKQYGELYDKGELTEESIQEGIDKLISMGAPQSQINTLKRYQNLTTEATNDAEVTEMLNELNSVGALTMSDIMNSNASQEVKVKFRKKFKQSDTPAAKGALGDVESLVKNRASYGFEDQGGRKDPTTLRAIEMAKHQVRVRAQEMIDEGVPPSQAWNDAAKDFKKEFGTDPRVGPWKFDLKNGYDRVGNTADPIKAVRDIRNKIREDKDYWTHEPVIPKTTLERKSMKSKQTGEYTVSNESKIISGYYTGKSAIDVEIEQYNVHELPVPPALQLNQDTENSVAPEVSAIIKNYPTKQAAYMAFNGQGVRGERNIRPGLRATSRVFHVTSEGKVGGTGAGGNPNAYRPHLHFEPVADNPSAYAQTRDTAISAAYAYLKDGYQVHLSNTGDWITADMSYSEISRLIQREQTTHGVRNPGAIDMAPWTTQSGPGEMATHIPLETVSGVYNTYSAGGNGIDVSYDPQALELLRRNEYDVTDYTGEIRTTRGGIKYWFNNAGKLVAQEPGKQPSEKPIKYLELYTDDTI